MLLRKKRDRMSICLLFLKTVSCVVLASSAATVEANRKEKLFPIFQIVSFPNIACIGTGSKNGTCYSAAECSSKGGVSGGSCAQSYGICCVFTSSCGSSSSKNCTYFESSGTESGACWVRICKCSSNICQLRLDFDQFVITGPTTVVTTIARLSNGVPVGTAAQGVAATASSQCLTDTFSVTNPNGNAPPVICGINTGEHSKEEKNYYLDARMHYLAVYVDASDSCNDLTFQLGDSAVGTSLAQRQWSIKITQYDCSYQNLAPAGCTQYFFGTASTSVMTYNFQGGKHLANQDQNICVRRERGNCRICWTAETATDFSVSSVANANAAMQSKCCRYGLNGAGASGADCVTIPGAMNTLKTKRGNERICGKNGLAAHKNPAIKTSTASNVTVCSVSVPFNIRFLSDGFEFAAEAALDSTTTTGFKLVYIQSATSC